MEEIKTVVITGASGSMGSAAVKAASGKGYRVIMACRNLEKAASVREGILCDVPDADIALRRLDLASLRSVADFAASVKEEGIAVSALFNNAGVINRDWKLTEDNFENTLQTNCIAPVLLSRLLLPALAQNAVIVNMVSLTCRFGHVGKDLFRQPERKFSQLGTYSDTKLALLLATIALSRRLREDGCPVRVNVADPGIVNSNMITMHRWFDPIADVVARPFFSSPEKGVAPALRALESTADLHYFVGRKSFRIPLRYMEHPMVEWIWSELQPVFDNLSLNL